MPNVADMKRRPAVAALVLLVAGCSSGGGSRTAAGLPSPSLTTTAAVPSEPAALPSSGGQSAVPAEKNPPGDIPDNVAFVRYVNATGKYSFTHPEGWAETTRGSTVTFTDKLNGVQVKLGALTTVPTVSSAMQRDVPALTGSQAAFELRNVTVVTEPGGSGVRIVYRRNSAPDPVTGRQYRDEVERYELVTSGREVIVELFGPVGSDNVDAYKTMITSLNLS
ncbi:MAG: lipoprotein [Mycobacteriales bacterium]